MQRKRILSTVTAAGFGLALAAAASSPSWAAASAAGASGGAGAQEGASGAAGPEVCQVIDFEKAAVTPIASTGTVPPTVRYRLTVSGRRPATNVSVSLVPLVYVRQPEFWGIEVTGCSSGIGLPVVKSYTATFDFTGPLGSCGIEVIGASSRQQFQLAPCAAVK